MEKFETERRCCSLRMKCPHCGHWNRFPVNKIFIEQKTSEPKVKTLFHILNCLLKPLQLHKGK